MSNVIIYKTGRQTLDFKACKISGNQRYIKLWCKEKGVTCSIILSEEQLIKNKEHDIEYLMSKYGKTSYNVCKFMKTSYEIEENFDYEKYKNNVEQYQYIGCHNKRIVFEWLKENEIILDGYTHIFDLIEKYNMPYELTNI